MTTDAALPDTALPNTVVTLTGTDFADRVLRRSGWNPGHHATGSSN